MIYDEPNGWCFIHIPKNAGSSVNNASFHGGNSALGNLRHMFPSDNTVTRMSSASFIRHNKWSYWKKEVPRGLRPIAIIRNPWARCVSLYLYNLKLALKRKDEDWAKKDHARLTKEGFKNSWMPGGFFVDGHGEQAEYSDETGRAWAQCDQQASWLSVNGTVVGDFYRLEDQMDKLMQRMNIMEMPWVNRTSAFDYRMYYDSQLEDRIGQLFNIDIELGKYEF